MGKSIRSLAYLFLIASLSHITMFANTKSGKLKLESATFSISINGYYFKPISVESSFKWREVLAPLAPSVTSPIYLCQGRTADPLTATASTGATLIWYGTSATGGTASSTAPIPSTTAVGQTKYYVSQSDSTGEGPRAEIVVNVVADNGGAILNLRCDPTQIAAADKNSSVFFDWGNTVGLPNQYTYSYTVDGGAAVTGTTAPTNLQVRGLLPGQTVTLTLAHTTYPCDRSEITCSVPCGTSTVTPTFTPIPPFCSGTIPAPLLPAVSNEGITGTWSPATVNNTISAVYTFTPDPILFPCAVTQTMSVTVDPLVTPVFSGIPAVVCQGAAAPILPSNSSNVTPITGTWTPATVNTAILGTFSYTFTPNSGQCTSATPTSVSIRIDPVLTPTFTAVAPICSGASLSPLPTTSNNGITGVWSPSLNNTATTTYTFAPTAGQCATTATMTISVAPIGTPTFTAVSAICSGSPLTPLPTTSNNGYTGTWSPALDNTATRTYTFTPNAGQCATTANLTITVNPLITVNFASIPASVCRNATAPILPSSSSNATPVAGTWSPATVNTSVSGTFNYVFTPNSGQCASSPTTTVTITVNPNVTPTFTAVAAICSGATLAALPTTSNNGISGTWSPSLNNTATTTYTFAPTAGQCATASSMTISVAPIGTPIFTAVSAICTGSTLSPLPTTSNNGYTGAWSPALDNTATTTYVFTPSAGQCATVANLTITVNQLRIPNFLNVPTIVCENSIAPSLPSSSSNTPSITGSWNPAIVNTSVVGTADYLFTPNAGQCAATTTITITVNASNTLADFSWTVTEAFSNNQVITVSASGTGTFLYRLDDGPFQESPIFEYVSPGEHSVTVADVTGCSASITRNNILVIGYPKFFTPNNDGYNDFWNVFTLEDKLGSKIQIFDRYGKLIKEITPNGTGWNGTYNGSPLPATDYWFVVDYPEDGIIKKFRSHFSLKR
jgi:gliding motility-associated-like protein